MKIVESIFNNNKANDIRLAKGKICYFMRGLTDFCASDNCTYQNSLRCSQTYRYSESAWKLRDVKDCKGLVGDHCVPLNLIFEYLLHKKSASELGKYDVRNLLNSHLQVVMITKDEDRILTNNKLKSNMPENLKFNDNDNIYSRYDAVGIKLEVDSMQNSLKVKT